MKQLLMPDFDAKFWSQIFDVIFFALEPAVDQMFLQCPCHFFRRDYPVIAGH